MLKFKHKKAKIYWKPDLSIPLPPKQRSCSCWEVFTQEDATIPANSSKMARLHFGVYIKRRCYLKFKSSFKTFEV